MKKTVWLLLLAYGLVHAQTVDRKKVDSLLTLLPKTTQDTAKVSIFNELSEAYIRKDSARSLNYSRQAFALSQKIGWDEGMARSLYFIGNNYNLFGTYSKAEPYLQRALRLAKNKLLISKILFSIGSTRLNQSRYPEALDAWLKSLKIKESLRDRSGMALLSLNIGTVYLSTEQNDKALQYLHKALGMMHQMGDYSSDSMLLRNIGVAHYGLGHLQKGLEFLDQARLISIRDGDQTTQASILSDMALVYIDLSAYQKAIDYSKTSIAMMPDGFRDAENTAFGYGVIGDAYIELAKSNRNNSRQLDSAVIYLGKAIGIHREVNAMRSLYDDYASLSAARKLQGKYREALQAYETSIMYRDSMYNADNRETIKNLEDKRAIELRDNKIKINSLKLESKEKQKWYLIGGLILLAVIGLLFFRQSQNRRKTNRKLRMLNADLDQKNASLDQANKTKARFFSILNHDLRSPVYNLIHYLQLQKDSPELLDAEMKKNIETRNMAAAENLLQSMEDLLLWSKGQMEQFRPEFSEVPVAALFADIRNHFAGFDHIRTDETDASQTIYTDENYLKTILRNLTGNAIKALADTANPAIVWKFWTQDGQSFLSVTDNGPGGTSEQFRALYDETEVIGIRSGLGLHLIRDLAAAINCRISVDSDLGSGTTFTLSFA